MYKRSVLLTLILCFVLCSCDWNPFGIPRDLTIETKSELGPETLARIDAINQALRDGPNIGAETRDLIREVNETIRNGIKAGLDDATLSRIDRLLTAIEKGVGIQFGLDDKTLATVNGLINSIDSMPDRWEASATEIVKVLEGSSARVAADMAKQVKSLMEEARLNTQQVVATAGIEFRCNVDFLGMRAGSTINEFIGRSIIGRLKAIITREKVKPVQPTPWVCGIIPDRVDLTRKAGRFVFEKGIITITGYNYVDANLPQVRVVNESGQPLDAIHLQAHRSSPYQLQINLQEVDFGLVPVRSRVVLQWPNVPDTSSLAILVPERQPELTIRDNSVAVYDGPGTAYRRLGFASQGAIYTVKGRTGDSAWWQIDYTGQTGWVPSASVTRNDDLPVSVASSIPLPPPVAHFQGTPRSGSAPLQVTFEDRSEGSPTTWRWEFGDGSTSTSRNPVYTYRTPGSYTVRLTVSNAQGENTRSEVGYITVAPPAPRADFRANPSAGTVPLEVSFQDTSANSPTSWKWEFGDGATSTLQHPRHRYTTSGTYTVRLTATNAQGTDTKTQNSCVTVKPQPLRALFTGDPRSGKVPLTVRFRDQSEGNPTAWKWEFGDGTFSTQQHPTHEYTKPGSYIVRLTVTRASDRGTDTRDASSYIVLQRLPDPLYTEWVSEEGGSPPASCPAGYVAQGIKCRGGDCDDVSLYCAPYVDGADRTARTYWSPWFSEESPGFAKNETQWVNALKCRGDNCDDLSLRFLATYYLKNTQVCTYIPAISEEQKDGAKCPAGWFVSGMKCYGDNCDDISLYCCKAQ
jgi:PKD repeat protein